MDNLGEESDFSFGSLSGFYFITYHVFIFWYTTVKHNYLNNYARGPEYSVMTDFRTPGDTTEMSHKTNNLRSAISNKHPSINTTYNIPTPQR